MAVRKRMSDVDQEQKRPLTLTRSGTLGLSRPAESGQVKQSFSHGRSKTVAVEVRKKRIILPGQSPEPAKAEDAAAESRQRSVDEEARRKEEESRREVAERAGKAAAAKVAALAAAGKVPAEEEEEAPSAFRRGRPDIRRPATPARRDQPRRRDGRLTVTRALSDEDERTRSLASVRRARERERLRLHGEAEQIKIVREVIIPETITVQELANRMAERGVDHLVDRRHDAHAHQAFDHIDADTAELVVGEF